MCYRTKIIMAHFAKALAAEQSRPLPMKPKCAQRKPVRPSYTQIKQVLHGLVWMATQVHPDRFVQFLDINNYEIAVGLVCAMLADHYALFTQQVNAIAASLMTFMEKAKIKDISTMVEWRQNAAACNQVAVTLTTIKERKAAFPDHYQIHYWWVIDPSRIRGQPLIHCSMATPESFSNPESSTTTTTQLYDIRVDSHHFNNENLMASDVNAPAHKAMEMMTLSENYLGVRNRTFRRVIDVMGVDDQIFPAMLRLPSMTLIAYIDDPEIDTTPHKKDIQPWIRCLLTNYVLSLVLDEGFKPRIGDIIDHTTAKHLRGYLDKCALTINNSERWKNLIKVEAWMFLTAHIIGFVNMFVRNDDVPFFVNDLLSASVRTGQCKEDQQFDQNLEIDEAFMAGLNTDLWMSTFNGTDLKSILQRIEIIGTFPGYILALSLPECYRIFMWIDKRNWKTKFKNIPATAKRTRIQELIHDFLIGLGRMMRSGQKACETAPVTDKTKKFYNDLHRVVSKLHHLNDQLKPKPHRDPKPQSDGDIMDTVFRLEDESDDELEDLMSTLPCLSEFKDFHPLADDSEEDSSLESSSSSSNESSDVQRNRRSVGRMDVESDSEDDNDEDNYCPIADAESKRAEQKRKNEAIKKRERTKRNKEEKKKKRAENKRKKEEKKKKKKKRAEKKRKKRADKKRMKNPGKMEVDDVADTSSNSVNRRKPRSSKKVTKKLFSKEPPVISTNDVGGATNPNEPKLHTKYGYLMGSEWPGGAPEPLFTDLADAQEQHIPSPLSEEFLKKMEEQLQQIKALKPAERRTGAFDLLCSLYDLKRDFRGSQIKSSKMASDMKIKWYLEHITEDGVRLTGRKGNPNFYMGLPAAIGFCADGTRREAFKQIFGLLGNCHAGDSAPMTPTSRAKWFNRTLDTVLNYVVAESLLGKDWQKILKTRGYVYSLDGVRVKSRDLSHMIGAQAMFNTKREPEEESGCLVSSMRLLWAHQLKMVAEKYTKRKLFWRQGLKMFDCDECHEITPRCKKGHVTCIICSNTQYFNAKSVVITMSANRMTKWSHIMNTHTPYLVMAVWRMVQDAQRMGFAWNQLWDYYTNNPDIRMITQSLTESTTAPLMDTKEIKGSAHCYWGAEPSPHGHALFNNKWRGRTPQACTEDRQKMAEYIADNYTDYFTTVPPKSEESQQCRLYHKDKKRRYDDQRINHQREYMRIDDIDFHCEVFWNRLCTDDCGLEVPVDYHKLDFPGTVLELKRWEAEQHGESEGGDEESQDYEDDEGRQTFESDHPSSSQPEDQSSDVQILSRPNKIKDGHEDSSSDDDDDDEEEEEEEEEEEDEDDVDAMDEDEDGVDAMDEDDSGVDIDNTTREDEDDEDDSGVDIGSTGDHRRTDAYGDTAESTIQTPSDRNTTNHSNTSSTDANCDSTESAQSPHSGTPSVNHGYKKGRIGGHRESPKCSRQSTTNRSRKTRQSSSNANTGSNQREDKRDRSRHNRSLSSNRSNTSMMESAGPTNHSAQRPRVTSRRDRSRPPESPPATNRATRRKPAGSLQHHSRVHESPTSTNTAGRVGRRLQNAQRLKSSSPQKRKLPENTEKSASRPAKLRKRERESCTAEAKRLKKRKDKDHDGGGSGGARRGQGRTKVPTSLTRGPPSSGRKTTANRARSRRSGSSRTQKRLPICGEDLDPNNRRIRECLQESVQIIGDSGGYDIAPIIYPAALENEAESSFSEVANNAVRNMNAGDSVNVDADFSQMDDGQKRCEPLTCSDRASDHKEDVLECLPMKAKQRKERVIMKHFRLDADGIAMEREQVQSRVTRRKLKSFKSLNAIHPSKMIMFRSRQIKVETIIDNDAGYQIIGRFVVVHKATGQISENIILVQSVEDYDPCFGGNLNTIFVDVEKSSLFQRNPVLHKYYRSLTKLLLSNSAVSCHWTPPNRKKFCEWVLRDCDVSKLKLETKPGWRLCKFKTLIFPKRSTQVFPNSTSLTMAVIQERMCSYSDKIMLSPLHGRTAGTLLFRISFAATDRSVNGMLPPASIDHIEQIIDRKGGGHWKSTMSHWARKCVIPADEQISRLSQDIPSGYICDHRNVLSPKNTTLHSMTPVHKRREIERADKSWWSRDFRQNLDGNCSVLYKKSVMNMHHDCPKFRNQKYLRYIDGSSRMLQDWAKGHCNEYVYWLLETLMRVPFVSNKGLGVIQKVADLGYLPPAAVWHLAYTAGHLIFGPGYYKLQHYDQKECLRLVIFEWQMMITTLVLETNGGSGVFAWNPVHIQLGGLDLDLSLNDGDSEEDEHDGESSFFLRNPLKLDFSMYSSRKSHHPRVDLTRIGKKSRVGVNMNHRRSGPRRDRKWTERRRATLGRGGGKRMERRRRDMG